MAEIKLVESTRAPEPRVTITIEVAVSTAKILKEDAQIWGSQGKVVDMAVRNWARRHDAVRQHRDGGMVDDES